MSTSQPKVFISYAWSSKKDVKTFVEQLRKHGINVTWDEDWRLGVLLPYSMEQGIVESDYVLYICTPDYKIKADNRDGGIAMESNIITGELYEKHNHLKYIPILFSGTWNSSQPIWGSGKLGVDLCNPDRRKEEFYKLVATLKRSPG